ncbi:MAG TPA: DNA translocase FtsK [Candidatus Dormibacteraeota bacterium]|nr:DNA translocase FtsK [Candidatus Dormibacteraeota bacterium]
MGAAAMVALPGRDALSPLLGVGVWLTAAGLLTTGVRLVRGHGWVVAWGCLAAGLGSLGLVAVIHPQAGGEAGQGLADWLSGLLTSGGAAIALLVLTCLGLVLAVDFRLDRAAALAWAHVGPRAHRAARAAWERRATAPAAASLPPLLVAPPAGPLPPIGGLMPVEGNAEAERGDDADPAPECRADPADPAMAGATTVATSAPTPVAQPPHAAGRPAAHVGGETERPQAVPAVAAPPGAWRLPNHALLEVAAGDRDRLEREVRETVAKIEATLASFGLETRVSGVNTGPTVTQYELQPAAGVSVRRITSRQTDLSLALANTVRIEAPIPGKAAIGIEVPNKAAQLVTLRTTVHSPDFRGMHSRLAVALGADVSGQPVIGDLARMPHLLIAGATGSGKSVCLNVILAGLLLQATPAQLRLILVDPKRVELAGFAGIPHLLVPVVVEPDAVVAALRGVVREMEGRYRTLAARHVRNIDGFNALAGADPLARIVVVIDELADLMMVAAGEIEELICRVAQLGRAAGIHLVVATQRPSADIITGLIKANIPSRIAFAVSSGVDSRVILDQAGAEKLLGRGDMLYLPVDQGNARRLQGAYVSDRELERLIAHWTAQGRPTYQLAIVDATAGELVRDLVADGGGPA